MKKLFNYTFFVLSTTLMLIGCSSSSDDQTPTGYPETEAELKTALSKVWVFPENSTYLSLEFGANNSYTLLSSEPFSRAESNVYLLSGTYSISTDLHDITLSDFGKVVVSAIKSGEIDMTITPTGGTASSVKISEQQIASPSTSTDKKIKRVESIDENDGNGSVDYTYTAGKLSKIVFSFDEKQLSIPIVFQNNTMSYTLEGTEAIGKPGIFKVTYSLNASGLASSSIIEHDNVVVGYTYYTYNNSRQLICFRSTDKVGKFTEFCTASWKNGNVTSIYKERVHTCDNSSHMEGETTVYHHDHNGDGVFTDADRMTIDKFRCTYIYTDKINKGGYMYSIVMPEIFNSSDVFDHIGQWAGVLGVSCKNLMAQHESSDGDLSYTYNSDGYPTRMDVRFPSAPTDNWYVNQIFE